MSSRTEAHSDSRDRAASVDEPSSTEVERAIESFTNVLQDLQESHGRLEERAERVEAELCAANEELARKVEELARVKEHLESVLTSIPTGVVVYDASGEVASVNDAAVSILGVSRDDLVGAREVSGLAGEGADGTPEEVVLSNGTARVLARRYSHVSVDRSDAGGVEVIEDQSELVRAQERLHRLDKTAALGTMAGGVAHEIRNPLHGIQGFAELLIRETEGETRASSFAARIREGAREIEAIVASMLGVAGETDVHLEELDALDVAREAADTALRERSDPSPWTIEVAESGPTLRGDRLKLRHALRNLVANALDVQPGGGTVRIEASADEKAVSIEVHDAGPGLPPQDLHRLCDPFFTTRAEGTGLGLALAQRVAELHGGALTPLTAPSPLGGAAFVLTIPRQSQA
ncbi:MAG: ATP-binding protein [Planctomycetota bacterium]